MRPLLRDGGVRSDDLTRRLASEKERELGGRVEPRAEVGVDEVDAGEVVPDENLALLEFWHRDLGLVEDVDAARLGDGDGVHGGGEGRHG